MPILPRFMAQMFLLMLARANPLISILEEAILISLSSI